MVRSKQFDRHTALDDAMELFWERGYHATSVQDLVDHLGVNRQSLYDTFGGKDQLYLAALERYRTLAAQPVHKALEREGPMREVLARFFGDFLDHFLAGDWKGCFMVNATAELAGQNEDVSQVCAANTRQLEAAFLGLIARAQQAGELDPTRPALPVARFLVNTMNGLAVTAKATRDRKLLDQIVEVTLSALDR
jgi:TetR/AcrR family transcriptional regulator, transcriptional repressor for nem operon